ncbi:pre-mRNA-splicing factor SYF1 fand [Dermatophagoides farinae]|uniref:Pre-mrna-splicing factor syf1-like protein n=1 Tax=Dermatophagoides farinae TaxID=6954 RepID=A0A9D4P3N4_DERFA|nr:pre-mRNA-splicing factor syf1 homolog [Dermatophagoides farinae]KAH7642470.1 pre-mrna-splicing factor syf1-like protein [Dermatophagoides farinae]
MDNDTEKNSSIVISEEDLAHEEDILRNSYSIKHWLRYIDHKKESSNNVVNLLYERALKLMPGSYKLWYSYLKLRVKQTSSLSIFDPLVKDSNNCFERSLVFMHKMPRIWIEYLQFLISQCDLTKTRRTFDRALQALPITQHNRIWPLYLKFVKSHNLPETSIRVYRRYLMLSPEEAEDFIDYLISIERWDEAALKLTEIVNDEHFVSKQGRSKHQLWTELAEILCRHPGEIHSLNVDVIIREGIKRYVDQQGKLWISLAEYYTRSGLFDKARDIFEEALANIKTVRDFSQIFDAYTQSEEKLIQIRMNQENLSEDDEIELDLRMIRYEDIIERRPLLLNNVALRQNPHNVEEWLKRVKLLENKPAEIVEVYSDAVQTVQAKQAIGKYYLLWVKFAQFYESNGQLEDARLIFEKAVTVEYVKVEDLANVWCEWVEMEVRNNNFETALKLMQRAVSIPTRKTSYYDQSESVQNRLYKSLKIWSMYADLEESFGTFESTKAVYDKIIELKIVTPQIIINYGLFLEENGYFEESFKAYEKGIALFRWPNVFDIWNTYLTKFLRRYKGSKLERIRDLFEQCLEYCPATYCKHFFFLYAKCEEEYGLARNATTIYDRATKKVPSSERMEVFNIFIRKAAEMFGVTHTRSIYEKAIEMLPDAEAREMCLKFADLERKLGEIDRARAIYAHCSQICDPRTATTFWNAWKDFEIKHGNEDTVREMLRIKRSVMATFNTQVNFMSAQMMASAFHQQDKEQNNKMNDLENIAAEANQQTKQEIKNAVQFVKSDSATNNGNKMNETIIITDTANPDEINLDDDEDLDAEQSDGDEDENGQSSKTKLTEIEQKMVPKEVFGGLRNDDDDD